MCIYIGDHSFLNGDRSYEPGVRPFMFKSIIANNNKDFAGGINLYIYIY